MSRSRSARYGLKYVGSVDAPRRPGPIILATDASVAQNLVGCAFLATTGRFGLQGHTYPTYISGPDRTTIAELRAVGLAMPKLGLSESPEPVLILCDSQAALRYLADWAGGSERFPDGYLRTTRGQGQRPTLVDLQLRVQKYASLLTFQHQKGHAGHALNETADSMSKLAIRSVREGSTAVRAAPDLGRMWAERTLRDFHRDTA